MRMAISPRLAAELFEGAYCHKFSPFLKTRKTQTTVTAAPRARSNQLCYIILLKNTFASIIFQN